MKKLGFILMACALIFGTTQCKKNDETNKPENNDESVFITLTVGDGTRAEVVPEDDIAPVYYAEGDMIHVVSDGKYIGTLTYNGSDFTGDITNPTEGQPLHFYFLGNVTPNETLVVGETSTCSVVISDQTTSHPVISYAPSTQNYNVGTTNYTATLLNKCALVKFNVTTVSENATCITGMNNKVTVDFETNEFDYSQDDDGVITLSAGNGEKWVILLPQDALETGSEGSAYSVDGNYTGIRGAIPTIVDNDYLKNGIIVIVDTPVSGGVPMGAINGLFTINADGNQVYFSQGNLQYQASTNTWRFAENQWDYVGTQTPDYNGNVGGTVNGSDNNNISPTYNGWIDFFGWGTSGYHDANDPYNVNYQPWSTSNSLVNSSYNSYGYGPSTNMADPNLTDTSANYDWGVYNPINNGGNTANQWRTLTQPEWNYVFNTRTTTSGIRYAKANVNKGNGVILLPDDWSSGTYRLSNTNTYNASFSSNMITAAQWTALENAGAVFLPAAGYRSRTWGIYVGILGSYWSASYSYSSSAYGVMFGDVNLELNSSIRCHGKSVRLVRDY